LRSTTTRTVATTTTTTTTRTAATTATSTINIFSSQLLFKKNRDGATSSKNISFKLN